MPATAGRDSSDFGEESLLSHPLFGGGLPPLAEEHLQQAGLSYQSYDIAEDHLRQAQILAPDHFAVLIGLYRFYFYKGRMSEALGLANICLAKAAREKNFAADWWDVRSGDADFADYEDVLARFYMFCLKGYAYLNMRLGDLAEGRVAVEKLLQLDPSDKIGARLLFDILERARQDDGGQDDVGRDDD
jgi:tetratricopeptide (TPR) repeat protein